MGFLDRLKRGGGEEPPSSRSADAGVLVRPRPAQIDPAQRQAVQVHGDPRPPAVPLGAGQIRTPQTEQQPRSAPLAPPPPARGNPVAPTAAAGVRRVVSSLSELAQELPHWRGDWVAGVVASEAQQSLAVLWLGLGDVTLAGTAEALSGAHANNVRERLRNQMSLFLMPDVVVANGVIGQMLDEAFNSTRTKKENTGGTVTADNYELRVYDDVIAAAIEGRASDIHITVRKDCDKSMIALRMHGRYRPWRRDMSAKLVRGMLGAAFGQKLISKTNSRSSISWDNEVAFMTENVTAKGSKWNGRCNGRPDLRGYKLVIRLLESNPQPESIPTLTELGYVPSHIRILETAVRRNYGVIVIFGSTGSGKSTTLRTFIVKVTDPESLSVFSVESPVEYEMPGVTQISIPVDVSQTSDELAQKFTAALRDVMRMDPDVLMVGEIRDHESGKLVSEFSLSGHRCYTTAHGDGVVDGLQRLCGEQIGMPAELFGGGKFLSASIYQRLLPKLCTKCRLPATHPEHGLSPAKLDKLRTKFQLDPGTMFVANPAGCPHCTPDIPGLKANGTKGVTVAAEVLVPTAELRELAARRDWTAMTRAWRGTRKVGFGDPDMEGKTAFECALYLATTGVVSIPDVEAEFEPIDSYEIYPVAQGTSLRGG